MTPNIFKSLTFWTLVAGLAAFIARYYLPAFPLDASQILAGVLFLLGLIGVVPTLLARRALTALIINSLPFWQLVAGLAFFVINFFFPGFPYTAEVILGVVMFVLGLFNIHPELQLRGIQ